MATAVEQLREDEQAEGQVVDRAAVDEAAAELAAVPEPVEAAPEGAADEDGQLVIVVGGKNPTEHKIRLYAGGFSCEAPKDGWEKGSSYTLRVNVRCHRQAYIDVKDAKSGEVIGCREEFGLSIVGASLVK